jgi:hypothetical protein
LEQKAAEYQVSLIYVENVEEAEQEADALIQRVNQASGIVAEMNLSSDQERLSQMLKTYDQLVNDSQD